MAPFLFFCGKFMSREIKSLTSNEINLLIASARKHSRHPERDVCLIWLSYRHGLRISECLNLKWKNVFFDENRIYIQRAKGSISGYHPLSKEDRKYLLQLKRKSEWDTPNDFIFITERDTQMSRFNMNKLIKILSEKAGMDKIHPHMLRHSCGNHMALAGIPTINIQQWLGHKKIDNTVIYTEEAGRQFDNLQQWW